MYWTVATVSVNMYGNGVNFIHIFLLCSNRLLIVVKKIFYNNQHQNKILLTKIKNALIYGFILYNPRFKNISFYMVSL